jgi:hypothetical protein
MFNLIQHYICSQAIQANFGNITIPIIYASSSFLLNVELNIYEWFQICANADDV